MAGAPVIAPGPKCRLTASCFAGSMLDQRQAMAAARRQSLCSGGPRRAVLPARSESSLLPRMPACSLPCASSWARIDTRLLGACSRFLT